MCKATLLPDPDSPLTRMSRIGMAGPSLPAERLARLGGVVIGLALLVLDHAAIELVGQQVYGGVHVFLGGIGMDGITANVQRGFGLLSELLNRENTMHVDYVVEMTRNPFELLFHVRAHRLGDFDMMTGKRQLHDSSPFLALSISLCPICYFALSFISKGLPWLCVRSTAPVPAPRGISPPCGARLRCPRRRAVRRCGCRKAGCPSPLP